MIEDYSLSNLGTSKTEILEEGKNTRYNDFEDMVYRLQLTYDEIIDILDLKYVPSKRTSCSLNRDMYEKIEMDTILGHILPNNVKVSIATYDIRIKSSLRDNQTLMFTEKSFFIRY